MGKINPVADIKSRERVIEWNQGQLSAIEEADFREWKAKQADHSSEQLSKKLLEVGGAWSEAEGDSPDSPDANNLDGFEVGNYPITRVSASASRADVVTLAMLKSRPLPSDGGGSQIRTPRRA